MPIFEYHCENCNHDFECLVFGSERPGCPSCNSKSVAKQMSACGFVSKTASGETASSSASSSGCSGCAATGCSSCSSV